MSVRESVCERTRQAKAAHTQTYMTINSWHGAFFFFFSLSFRVRTLPVRKGYI